MNKKISNMTPLLACNGFALVWSLDRLARYIPDKDESINTYETKAINYDRAYLEMTMRQLPLFQADLEEPPGTKIRLVKLKKIDVSACTTNLQLQSDWFNRAKEYHGDACQ